MRAMVLAAGRGERMRPLTDHCPKSLLKAGGKELLRIHLERLAAAGVEAVVVNHAYLGQQIVTFVEQLDLTVPVWLSAEQQALETGGGIFQALPRLGSEPFLVVNGDIWTDYPFATLLERHWDDGCRAHLVLVDNPVQHPDGDFHFCAKTGVVVNELEYPRLTFSGISVLHPDVFTGRQGGAFPLVPLLRDLIARGEVTAEHYQGQWFDIGTPQRLQALNELIQGQSL